MDHAEFTQQCKDGQHSKSQLFQQKCQPEELADRLASPKQFIMLHLALQIS
jgi:hypothetical protein